MVVVRSGTNVGASRIGWWLLALDAALVALALGLFAAAGGTTLPGTAMGAAGFGTVGALVVSRHPRHRVGWIFCAVGVIAAVDAAADGWAMQGLHHVPGSLPSAISAAWVVDWLWVPLIGLPSTLLLLFFPDGRLVSPRWRPVLRVGIAAAAVSALSFALTPGRMSSGEAQLNYLPNPVGLPGVAGSVAAPLAVVALMVMLVMAGFAVASLVVRFRRADTEQRQQIKWFAYGGSILGAVIAVASPFWQVSPVPHYAVPGAFALAPVWAGVAILKYRLYDIDVVINKTVVLGVLVAFVTAVYVTVVVGIGAAIGHSAQSNPALSIVATALVAVAFQPVRSRAQHLANRLVYGHRATPYETLSAFAHRVGEALDAEELAPRMARILAEGTGAAHTGVFVRIGTQLACEAAWPPEAALLSPVPMLDGTLPPLPGATLALPVHHRGDLLGALTLSKPAGERLTPTEEKLARDVASQAGLVLRNMRLTEELLARLDELQASRQRLVAAQDQERRRLERNLHDGAQQQLVALAVKIRLARTLAERDAAKAEEMLTQAERDAAQTIEDLRDLARGIYPPLLADAGLGAALSSQARRAAVPVSVDAGDIGRYPQEVEGAVYFCTLEALQNVAKYAGASQVCVRLREESGALVFEVQDDGCGFDPAARSYGTGMQGMSDRLGALGGTLVVHSAPGQGTTVIGRVPVARDARVGGLQPAEEGPGEDLPPRLARV
jgi:signal transduction histidine kinase